MDLGNSKTLIVVGFIVIAVITVSSVGVAGLLFTPTSYGQNFLLQLVERNEDAALEYLTPEFRDVVRNACPSAAVTRCFRQYNQDEWGSLTRLQFVRRDESGEDELFHLFFAALDAPVSIVLHTRRVDGSYLIDGWRGFLVGASTEDENALLDGTREDSALIAPPSQ